MRLPHLVASLSAGALLAAAAARTPEAAAQSRGAATATSADEQIPGGRPRPGAILPANRIIAFYGNPLSRRMGVLGEYPPDLMLAMLDAEVATWQAADPGTPVKPARSSSTSRRCAAASISSSSKSAWPVSTPSAPTVASSSSVPD